MQPTIKDVAKTANVSISTISRYLSGKHVREWERIDEAIKLHNFVPRGYARSLRFGRSNIIGVIVPDLTNPYFASLMVGIEEITRGVGLEMMWVDTSESSVLERDALYAMLGYIDGLIITPVCETDLIPMLAKESGVKVVLVDRLVNEADQFDWVVVDNRLGARLAARHLIDMGHEYLGIINGPVNSTPGRERLEGFLEECREAGIVVEDSYRIDGGFREKGGFNAMGKILTSEKRPSAVFICNNLMTIGSIRRIKQELLSIPEDISIIGFDDFALSDLLSPPITVIDRPAEMQGKLAAQILVNTLKKKNVSSDERIQITLPSRLIVRESVKKLKDS